MKRQVKKTVHKGICMLLAGIAVFTAVVSKNCIKNAIATIKDTVTDLLNLNGNFFFHLIHLYFPPKSHNFLSNFMKKIQTLYFQTGKNDHAPRAYLNFP